MERSHRNDFGGMYLREFLTNGGTSNATGNYIAMTEFKFTATETCYVHQLILFLDVPNNPEGDRYSGINGGLTNGIQIYYKSKSSSDKIYLASANDHIDFGSWSHSTVGDFGMQVKLDFNDGKTCIKLYEGGEFGVELNDDFSSLDFHRFVIIGRK